MDCDVRDIRDPDLATVDALARAQLNARRLNTCLRLRNVSPVLQELIGLVGLDEVLSGRPCGEAEERKEALGVEECVEADDSTA